MCPFLRRPKHRLLSNMNFLLSSTDLLVNIWHLWMEWLSPQHLQVTGFEGTVLTLLDVLESSELLTPTLYDFDTVLDLSDAFTLVMNALDFERLTSLDGFSSENFKA